ncbi:MAG: phosphatase PAP2 family protein [Polyangiaceae bacterium]|nr:phosphatase PAP2 family protein [Polyangiaceae bacterium]
MRSVARALLWLGPDGLVTAVALAVVGSLVAALGGSLRLDAANASPLVLLAVLVGLTALARAPWLFGRRPGERRRFALALIGALRMWAPFVLLYLCYCALHDATPLLVGRSYEHELRAADEALFGVSPSFWLERFATPWLTDVMAFGYGLMFWLPLGVLVGLYLRDRKEAFREVAVALLAAFYCGFVLYLAVPARSPRLVFAYASELHGALGLYEAWTVAWDRLQEVSYDAFPSLHTAVSTLALVYARRTGPLLLPRTPRLGFWVYLPAVLLLQAATLYLRQHYFVDLVAGWLLAAAAAWAAPRILRGWVALEGRLGRAALGRAPAGGAFPGDA